MVEIAITDTPNDILESRYIYIQSMYMLNYNYDNLEDKNCYQRYEGNYIDAPSALQSIVDLGNHLITELKLDNIKDLELHKDNLDTYIRDWLLINPYPYCDVSFRDISKRFSKDSVLLAKIYDIHKWLVKIRNNIDDIICDPRDSKELDNLEEALNFINFDRRTRDAYNIDVVLDPCEFDLYEGKKEPIIYKLGLIRDRIFNEETAKLYCNFITRRMISILPCVIYFLEDYDVKEQIRVYDDITDEFRTIHEMKSIIGVACDELENRLISKSISGKIICSNPDCNNDFDDVNGQKYCKSIKCQKYRNNLKSKASYDRAQAKKASLKG